MRLFILTNHTIHDDQREDAIEHLGVDGFEDLPQNLKDLWGMVPPENDSIVEYVLPILQWLKEKVKPGDVIWAQGEWGVTMSAVLWAQSNHIRCVYATTKRVAQEMETENGVVVTHVFKHVRFRDFPSRSQFDF